MFRGLTDFLFLKSYYSVQHCGEQTILFKTVSQHLCYTCSHGNRCPFITHTHTHTPQNTHTHTHHKTHTYHKTHTHTYTTKNTHSHTLVWRTKILHCYRLQKNIPLRLVKQNTASPNTRTRFTAQPQVRGEWRAVPLLPSALCTDPMHSAGHAEATRRVNNLETRKVITHNGTETKHKVSPWTKHIILFEGAALDSQLADSVSCCHQCSCANQLICQWPVIYRLLYSLK